MTTGVAGNERDMSSIAFSFADLRRRAEFADIWLEDLKRVLQELENQRVIRAVAGAGHHAKRYTWSLLSE